MLVDWVSDAANLDFSNLFENAAVEEINRYRELFNTDRSEKRSYARFLW